jgi:hypothetical protein
MSRVGSTPNMGRPRRSPRTTNNRFGSAPSRTASMLMQLSTLPDDYGDDEPPEVTPIVIPGSDDSVQAPPPLVQVAPADVVPVVAADGIQAPPNPNGYAVMPRQPEWYLSQFWIFFSIAIMSLTTMNASMFIYVYNRTELKTVDVYNALFALFFYACIIASLAVVLVKIYNAKNFNMRMDFH